MSFRAAVVALVIGVAPCGAQVIATGRWPASLHFSDGDSVVATFSISEERNRLLIDVTSPNGNNWTLGNVRADSTRLRFSWTIDGQGEMQCALSRRSENYWEGHCERRPDRVLVTLRRPA